MSKTRGMLVTFEGPNGVGKSTVLKEVGVKLQRLGLDVLETKEPTESSLGDFVRRAEEVPDYSGIVLACLVAADRYFHLEHEIFSAISDGKVVLSDRYVESSLVLQRIDGLDKDFIWLLNSKIRIPDLSIILTAQPTTLIDRLGTRGTRLSRFEREHSAETEVEFYRDAYAFLSNRGFKFVILDNNDSGVDRNVEIIVGKIISMVKGDV